MKTPLARKIALAYVARLLRPVARFCVRHAIRFQDISELLKRAFVEAGCECTEDETTVSKLSAMTGLQRKDLARLLGKRASTGEDAPGARDLVTKVVGHWQTAPEFVTAKREPRVIPYQGDSPSFVELVRSISSDLNPAAVRNELLRTGIVEDSVRGLRLKRISYSPRGDVDHGMNVLEKDTADLISAIEENLFDDSKAPHLHARTEYDRIRRDALPEIRSWLVREGHRFHTAAREYLSKFDQDVNPDDSHSGKTAKVVVTAFSFTEEQK